MSTMSSEIIILIKNCTITIEKIYNTTYKNKNNCKQLKKIDQLV